ncbi:hypothetical protein [Streptomyces hundungensis]|uniref:hypothetical protein n=1 Tax=Streptomyces hundungensis TaxID=1077946 RepID=UPI0031E88372
MAALGTHATLLEPWPLHIGLYASQAGIARTSVKIASALSLAAIPSASQLPSTDRQPAKRE